MAGNLPPAGLFVDDDLTTEFNNSIRQLIADLGVPVKLFFAPSASGCPNCFQAPDGSSNGIFDSSNPFPLGQFHNPFPNGVTCPVCQGSHSIFTESSEIEITMLREWNPEDIDVTQYGVLPTNVVFTKAEGCFKNDINRAERAIVDGDQVVRLSDPIPAGLPPPQFVDCFWKKQD